MYILVMFAGRGLAVGTYVCQITGSIAGEIFSGILACGASRLSSIETLSIQLGNYTNCRKTVFNTLACERASVSLDHLEFGCYDVKLNICVSL